MAHEEPTFLTISQAASLLGTHPNTMRRRAQRNKLKGLHPGPMGIGALGKRFAANDKQ